MTTARMSVLVSFLVLSACAYAQERKDEAPAAQKGEAREVPDFDGVEVSHGIQAEVKVGPKSVRLEGPSDLLARVKLEVEDGKLVTRVEKQGIFSSFRGSKVRLHVTNPKVRSVGASGGAHMDAQATETERFSAEASGGAVVTVRDVDARTVEAEASGGSRVTLSGSAEELDAEASGGAEVLARDLRGLKTLKAEASGGSQVEANPSESVTGDASGGSTLQLGTRPGRSDVDTSGGSRIVYKD